MSTATAFNSGKTLKGDVITQEALDFDNPLFDSRKLSFDGRKHESLSSQQVSINPLARKGTLQRALSNKGGLGVSSRMHSASAGSLTSLDLNNATVMSSDEFKNLVQGLKSTEENAAILTRVKLCSSNKLFTSDQLLQLIDVTTSIKTQIEMIFILAPNLIDPKAKFDQFVGKYRFTEDKDKVTEYLTDATKKLSSLRYSRHTNLNVRQQRFGSTDSLSGKLVDNNTQRSRFASTDSANNNNNKSGSFYSNGLGSPTSPDNRPGVSQLDRELYKIDDSYREDSLQSIDCDVLLSPRTNDESDKKVAAAVVGDISSSTEALIIDRPSVADVKKRISAKLHSSGNAHLLSPQKNLATPTSSPRPTTSTTAKSAGASTVDLVKSSTSTKGASSISSLSPRPISASIQNNNNNTSNNSSKNSIISAAVTPLVPIKEMASPRAETPVVSSNNSNSNDAKNREELKRSSSEGTTTATTVHVSTTGGTNSKPASPSSSPKRIPFLSKLKSTFSPSTRKNTSTTTAAQEPPSLPSTEVVEVIKNDVTDLLRNNESPIRTIDNNTTTVTSTQPSTTTDINNNTSGDDGLLHYEGLLLSKAGWVTKSWCVYRVKIHGTVLTLCEENNHKKGNSSSSSVEYDLHSNVCTQLIIHCDVLRVLNKTQGINEVKVSGLIKKSNSHGIAAALKKELVVFRSVHTGYEESLQDLYQWKDYLLKANSSSSSNGTS